VAPRWDGHGLSPISGHGNVQVDSVHYTAQLKYLLVVLAPGTKPKELEALQPDLAAAEGLSTDGAIGGVVVALTTGVAITITCKYLTLQH
jgi:hypothetical protein